VNCKTIKLQNNINSKITQTNHFKILLYNSFTKI